jgi:hypothetical protein
MRRTASTIGTAVILVAFLSPPVGLAAWSLQGSFLGQRAVEAPTPVLKPGWPYSATCAASPFDECRVRIVVLDRIEPASPASPVPLAETEIALR